jgi:16S rRNA (guanine1516-N2)-methyltransferase
MLVTTSYKPTEQIIAKSQQIAAELGGRWVPRRQFSLPALRRRYTETEVMLLTEQELRYYRSDDTALFFHPSTAAIRIKRLERGETDPLLTLAEIAAGDSILDCTAGLASDSIVFSYAVGPSGQVTALESESTLVVLLREGLRHYQSPLPALNDAMRRIVLQHSDHLTLLRKMSDQSVDMIYFDPMFRSPITESSAMLPLRMLANGEAIQIEAIIEAKRVARKKIILKEHKDSSEFSRLGFTLGFRSQTNIAYGVIEL